MSSSEHFARPYVGKTTSKCNNKEDDSSLLLAHRARVYIHKNFPKFRHKSQICDVFTQKNEIVVLAALLYSRNYAFFFQNERNYRPGKKKEMKKPIV